MWKVIGKLRQSAKIFLRFALLWFFADVAYAVLPLGVLLFVNRILGDHLDKFLLLPEWSFATIVFYGVSIRSLIRQKAAKQSPTSYKLDTGVQFFIVMLVFAALTLMSVILLHRNVIAASAEPVLQTAQMLLFAVGIVATVFAALHEERSRTQQKATPASAT